MHRSYLAAVCPDFCLGSLHLTIRFALLFPLPYQYKVSRVARAPKDILPAYERKRQEDRPYSTLCTTLPLQSLSPRARRR